MDYIKIGKIVNAVALKGEVKVYNYSDPDRYEMINRVSLKPKAGAKDSNGKPLPQEYKQCNIENVRYQGPMVILKLSGISDRTAAESYKDWDVYLKFEDRPVLSENTYYIMDMVGSEVFDISSGSEVKLGELVGVLQNSAQDIYQIRKEDGQEMLVPAVSEFVKKVDTEQKRIVLSLIPGF